MSITTAFKKIRDVQLLITNPDVPETSIENAQVLVAQALTDLTDSGLVEIVEK